MVKAQHGTVQHPFQHGYTATNASGSVDIDAEVNGNASVSKAAAGTVDVGVDVLGNASGSVTVSGSVAIGVEAQGRATSPVNAAGTIGVGVRTDGAVVSGTNASGQIDLGVGVSGQTVVGIIPLRVGDIVADDIADQETPTLQIGETATLQLLISDPIGDYVTSDTIEDRYQDAREYLKTASDGVVDTDVDDAGNPWFREVLPESANVGSQLVDIRSHESVDNDLPPMWGVIVDGEDQSQALATHKRVDVDVFVLGALEDYSSESDVRDKAEIDVTHSIGGYVGDALADQPIPTVSVGSEESVTVAFNNLNVNSNVSDYVGLKDYLRYPEGVETETDGAGRAAFEEDIPSVSPVSSQLVRVETDGSEGTEDFWAVVTGGSEAEPASPTGRQLDLDLFVLGTVDEYPTESSIRDATELNLSWQVGNLLADGLATDTAPVLTRGEEVSVSFRFDNSDSDYESLKQYLAYPSVNSGTTEQGVPWFSERIPDISPVNSQVVQLQPDARSDAGFEDFWALIEGGSEETAPYPNERTVSVDLTVLGTVSEYSSESDLRDALEAEPL